MRFLYSPLRGEGRGGKERGGKRRKERTTGGSRGRGRVRLV